MKNIISYCTFLVLSLSLVIIAASSLQAAEVPPAVAVAAAQGWLNLDDTPLERAVASPLAVTSRSFADERGKTLYHVVSLADKGLIVVAGDDRIEPVIAWLPEAETFEPDPNNPLYALLEHDLRGRLAAAEAQTSRAVPAPDPKWDELLQASLLRQSRRLLDLSDVRVEPFVVSKWNQGNVNGQSCYNYYTPPYTPGSSTNYVCGCVATAMAQIMRYFEFPTVGVGQHTYTIFVEYPGDDSYTEETRTLLGGNGAGGAYNWEDMPLEPNLGITLAQRQAIGALTHDAGVAVGMEYTSGGSGANSMNATNQLMNIFGYSNAVYDYDDNNFSTDLYHIVNTNMDARLPVLFSIVRFDSQNNQYGHAVVGDGYGYQDSTPYHHINIGWGDSSYTAWYNLPTVDANNTYTDLYTITYNIYKTGTGEIISGRILDDQGNPLESAAVTAQGAGGGTYTATTDANGIYALTKLPSNSSYTISAAKAGFTFENQTASTSFSEYEATGNVWGVDFTGAPAEDDILLLMAPILAGIRAAQP